MVQSRAKVCCRLPDRTTGKTKRYHAHRISLGELAMCLFRPPTPPPLPEPTPTAPRPEPTAKRVVIGDKRSSRRRPGGTRRGRTRTLGTASLQIPLSNQGQTGMGNLNY